MTEYVFFCVTIILIVYSVVIRGLVLHWRPKLLSLENVILADGFLTHVRKKTLDVSHVYVTAIFTVLVSPFTVWCEPTFPLTKVQRKRSLAKLFLPLSNLFLITMLSFCLCVCARIDNFQVDQMPPLSFCFKTENSTTGSAFFKVINSNWTSQTRNMLTLCNTDDCHPAIRVCQNGEQPADLFATTICPFLIGLLILSFALSLFLSYLSNYDNLLDFSQCKIIHPVILQKYLQNSTSNETVEKRIQQMISNSSPDILNFPDPLTGNTCLHAAFQGMESNNFSICKINVLKQLVNHGGNMESENNKGQTLHSLLSTIKHVLNNNSIKLFKTTDNRERIEHSKLLELLSESSDGTQQKSRLKDFALSSNNLPLMKIFFCLGGNLNARNGENVTPLLSKLTEINDEEKTHSQSIEKITKTCVWILNMGGTDQVKTDAEKKKVLNFVTELDNQFSFKLRPEKLHSLLIYVGINYINGNINFRTFLEDLICMGCKIDHPNIYNSENPELTLLHMSCDSGNFTATKFLVTNHAKINQRDSFGWTPLHYAVRKGTLKVVKHLTEKNADVNIKNLEGQTALHLAFQNWNLKIATHLIEEVSDINVADHDGMTLLHYASKHQQDKIVELLIAKTASIDKKNRQGKTPLHLVSENRSNYEPRNGKKCCDLLLDAAETNIKLEFVNICDNSKRTALHHAVDTMSPNATIVETLIENGAYVNKADAFGKTPLNYVTENEMPIDLRKQIQEKFPSSGAGCSSHPSWYNRLTFWLSADEELERPHHRFYLAEYAENEDISHIENPSLIRKVKYKRRNIIEVVSIYWLNVRKGLGKHPPGKYSVRIRVYVDQNTHFTKEGPLLYMIVNKVPPRESCNEASKIPLLTESFPYTTWSDLANSRYQGKQKIVKDNTSDNWYFVYLDQFETDCYEELEFVLEEKNACCKKWFKLDYVDLLLDSLKPGELFDFVNFETCGIVVRKI
jgi:ankyrin repeat protein